jgi:hypothetical protein
VVDADDHGLARVDGRHEERLAAIARAKEEIQARAQARFEREQAEF